MKKSIQVFIGIFILISAASCVIVDNSPGPSGSDGKAYIGIDYDSEPPYSYWDNNTGTPPAPVYGVYYPSLAGIYEFEYFVNPEEYWFGTYEIWIERGGPGGANGERGADGLDNYLMLVCNYEGFYGDRNFYKTAETSDNWITIEQGNTKVVMKKTTVSKRSPRGK